MGQGEQIIVDGNIIRTSNIAEIISMEKYYETYPERKPNNYGQPYPAVKGNVFTRASKNGKERFLIGLRRTSPNSSLIRSIEAGTGVFKKNTYEPIFRFKYIYSICLVFLLSVAGGTTGVYPCLYHLCFELITIS